MQAAFWQVWLELAPWLLVGAALAGLLHAALPVGLLRRHLAGRGGVARAVLLGAPLPLCSCGVIPTGLGLKKQGVGDGATVAFLISTPQTGVDSVLVTAAVLGWPLALWKVVLAVVTGLLGGWWAGALQPRERADLLPIAEATSPGEATADAGQHRPGLAGGAAHAVAMLRSIWRWVLVGVAVSALIKVWLPVDGLGVLADYGGLVGMLAALVVSLPLYMCATASVPIAASLVAAGLPPGAAIVLLMAGPATNVATVGAVFRALGPRMLAVYLAAIVTGSIAGGLVYECVAASALPGAGWVAAEHPAAHPHAAHNHTAIPAPWWRVASAWLLAAGFLWFAVADAWRWLARWASPANRPTGRSAVTLSVEGMTCGNCVAKLERAVAADPAVNGVRVTLAPGRVTADGPITDTRLRELVRGAGFSPR